MDKAKEEAKNILDVRERLKLLDSLIDEARNLLEKGSPKLLHNLDVCKTCGYPKNLERDIVFLNTNPLSLAEYMEDRCEKCGHVKDGSTIMLFKYLRKISNLKKSGEK